MELAPGPLALIHSGPGCLPGGHQLLIAVVRVMLMLVAFVRIVDATRLIAVVLVFVALVGVVDVSSSFRFAHADYLPTRFPGTNPEFHCASGPGWIQGTVPTSPSTRVSSGTARSCGNAEGLPRKFITQDCGLVELATGHAVEEVERAISQTGPKGFIYSVPGRLEVWPESHWPGFVLHQTDVLSSI